MSPSIAAVDALLAMSLPTDTHKGQPLLLLVGHEAPDSPLESVDAEPSMKKIGTKQAAFKRVNNEHMAGAFSCEVSPILRKIQHLPHVADRM